MENETTVNISYLSPNQIDRAFEKEIIELAKPFGGKEYGGAGFSFEDNRRDFDTSFPDTESAEKFLKRLARIKKYKVRGNLV